MLKANFAPKKEVNPEEKREDKSEEFRKKAIESIGGSMVFVERKKLVHDPK